MSWLDCDACGAGQLVSVVCGLVLLVYLSVSKPGTEEYVASGILLGAGLLFVLWMNKNPFNQSEKVEFYQDGKSYTDPDKGFFKSDQSEGNIYIG